MRRPSSRDYAATTAGEVPESRAPQEEIYPLVPTCGSTQRVGANTERKKFEDIISNLPSSSQALEASAHPAKESGVEFGGACIQLNE